MFIIIETAIEYFYVSDTDLFLSLMKNIKALSRDFSEEKPLLVLRASQTLPLLLFTTACYFVCEVPCSKVYYAFLDKTFLIIVLAVSQLK